MWECYLCGREVKNPRGGLYVTDSFSTGVYKIPIYMRIFLCIRCFYKKYPGIAARGCNILFFYGLEEVGKQL